jgi:hypothetical protein
VRDDDLTAGSLPPWFRRWGIGAWLVVDKVQDWAQSLGITSASDATKDIKQAAPDIGRTLLKGVATGISGLKSLVVFIGFTIFTSFFLLKDGPSMGRWIERHMGMRPAESRIVTGDILQALPVRHGGPDPCRATCVRARPRPRSPRGAEGTAGGCGAAAGGRGGVTPLTPAASRASRDCAPHRSR